MKCPRCRAEILSDTLKTCPYCSSSLAIPLEKDKKVESKINHETSEIAKQIKEAIEAQKAIYKIDKIEKTEKKVTKKLEKNERKKYSSSDIAILFVSLALTFIVLAITLSLILKK